MTVFTPRLMLPLWGWRSSFASVFWTLLVLLNAVWEDVKCKLGRCYRLVSHDCGLYINALYEQEMRKCVYEDDVKIVILCFNLV